MSHTKIYKDAVITQQIAGKILAQANKEDNIIIKKQMRQLAGKQIAAANTIIRNEQEKSKEKSKEKVNIKIHVKVKQ